MLSSRVKNPLSGSITSRRPQLRVVCHAQPPLAANHRPSVPSSSSSCLLPTSASTASTWRWLAVVALAVVVLATCVPEWLGGSRYGAVALASPVPNPNPNPFALPLPVPMPMPLAQAQQPPPAAPAPPRPPAPAPPAQPAPPRPPAQQQPPVAQRPPAPAPGTQPAPPARKSPVAAQPARPTGQAGARPPASRANTAPRATGTASARASGARPTQRKTIIQTKLGPLAKEDIDAAVNDPSKFSFTKPVIVGMAVGGGFMVVLLFVLGAAITRSSRR